MEDQVEVEREESEVKEKRTWMTINGMRLKNTLSHEVHVTTDIKKCNGNCAL